MNWLTNEFLFYGGLIVTGCSVVSAIIYFSISKVKAIKLNSELDKEYGEIKKK